MVKNQLYDLEMERGLISSILSSPEVIEDIIELLSVNDFHFHPHKVLYKEMEDQYFKEGQISKVKVMQLLKKKYPKTDSNSFFTPDYLIPLEVKNIAQELKQLSQKRLIKTSLKTSYQILMDEGLTADEIKSKVQDNVFKATSDLKGTKLIYDVKEVAEKAFKRLKEREEGVRPEKIKTGIRSLDGMLNGGFSRKQLTILAGRPSMGKTAMALILADAVLEYKTIPTLYISLEMDRIKLLDRLLIQKSKVAADDFYNVKKGDNLPLNGQQKKSIELAYSKLLKKPFKVIDKRGLTVDEIKSAARMSNITFGGELGFIIVDYLTEIKINVKGARWDKGVAEVIRELRNLAAELNCHILLLHQINREFRHRDSKRPLLSDLRDTGEAEEKIDNGLLLHRPSYYISREDGIDEPLMQEDVELNVAKQREGKTGIIYFNWYPEILYFQDNVDFKGNGKIYYLKN